MLLNILVSISLYMLLLGNVSADGAPNPLLEAMHKAEGETLDRLNQEREALNSSINQKLDSKESVRKSNKEIELSHIEKLAREVDLLRTKSVFVKVNALSTKNPRKVKKVGSITNYSYREGQIYELHAGVDRVSSIVLRPGEVLSSSPISGDTVRWKIGTTESGSGNNRKTTIVVKPLEEGIETNILIPTTERTYHLRAVSGDWYMPQISWNYPELELEELEKESSARELDINLEFSPEELSFNYEIEGDDYPWRPLRVFDDGQKTYFHMSKEIESREAPALFIVDDGSDPRLINYRVKGDYYIVDGLFDKAELRVGREEVVEVISESYKPSLFERIF